MVQKLTYNRTAPLPMLFSQAQQLADVTLRPHLQRFLLERLDPAGLGRIDGCELYCMLLLCSKGKFEQKCALVVDLFAFERRTELLAPEFEFFLDGLFRALGKCVLTAGEKPGLLRLGEEEITRMAGEVFGKDKLLDKDKLFKALSRAELGALIRGLDGRIAAEGELRREAALREIQGLTVIKKLVQTMVQRVEEALKK